MSLTRTPIRTTRVGNTRTHDRGLTVSCLTNSVRKIIPEFGALNRKSMYLSQFDFDILGIIEMAEFEDHKWTWRTIMR